jgi:hypothetical protein
MTVAWDLECGSSQLQPRLYLVSDPATRGRVGLRPGQWAVGAVMALVVLVALLLLALPLPSLGGRTLAQATPAPGQEYIVKAGDTLGSIAHRADPAQAAALTQRLAAETGSPYVVPGEHIFIP